MFLRFHPLLLGFAAMFAVSACGSGPAVPEQPEEVEVSVRPMPGDTLMLGYGAALAVHDTLLLIQDNNAPGYIMRLCGYPSLRPLYNFVVKGKGPGELTGVGDFIVDGDSLRLYSNNEPKMLVYAWADLVRGELRPARTITYPAECANVSSLGKASDGRFVLGKYLGDPKAGRILLVDGEGGVIGPRFSIPYTTEEAEQVSAYGDALIPMLWQATMAVDDEWVVLGTRLGDVLEIYNLGDTTRNRVVRGPDGVPEVGVSDNSITFGTRSGYQCLQIDDDRIYALYDGAEFHPADDIEAVDTVKIRQLRIFDMEGHWLKTCMLDRPISAFYLMNDGKTAVAIDPKSEYQLCTFEIPD